MGSEVSGALGGAGHALCPRVQHAGEGTTPAPATGRGPCLWARPQEAQGRPHAEPFWGARSGPSLQMWARAAGQGHVSPVGGPRTGPTPRFLMCLLGEGVSKTISKAGGSPEKAASFPLGRGNFKGDPAAKKVSKKPLPFYGLQITPWPAAVRRGCWENVLKETHP